MLGCIPLWTDSIWTVEAWYCRSPGFAGEILMICVLKQMPQMWQSIIKSRHDLAVKIMRFLMSCSVCPKMRPNSSATQVLLRPPSSAWAEGFDPFGEEQKKQATQLLVSWVDLGGGVQSLGKPCWSSSMTYWCLAGNGSDWGLLGWLLLVIMDHSLTPY